LKEETSSPTVSTEALFLTCVIDAEEGRDVATVDVPGAFMHADMNETVWVQLVGTMAELLIKIDPAKYGPYATHEQGRTVLYVCLKKALYGTLQAVLLFWKLLSTKLQEWGYTINPYDWCIANKMIAGKQCTVAWHVDDLKISHVSLDVVTGVIAQLNEEFGTLTPLTVTRGKKHDYLGMTIDYSIPGKVQISMTDYIMTMLNELPLDMQGVAATLAAAHLFEVNSIDPILLDKPTKEFFHTNIAKLLFLAKHARPDILTAMSFLCTSVVAQGQLARRVTWLDPIDDGEMVQQSVANWTEAKVRANMRDQYCTKGSFHGKGVNRGQDRDRDRDRERGRNQGS